eukprot:3742352-Prymnesium_polylepis.1
MRADEGGARAREVVSKWGYRQATHASVVRLALRSALREGVELRRQVRARCVRVRARRRVARRQ